MKRQFVSGFRSVTLLLFVALANFSLRAADTNELPAGVEARTYTGWPNSIYLNASETPVQVVIVPSVGGRIVHYSFNGQNILFENTASQGATLLNSSDDLQIGGYQCDLGPASRHLAAHWSLIEGPQRWKSDALFSAKLFGATETNLGVAIDKDFVLDGDSGELGLAQRLRNVSAKEVSYSLIDRTACKGGGFVFFPLNKKSRFKAGWSQWHDAAGKQQLDGDSPNVLDARVIDGVLVARTGANVTRIGADSDAGWIAYAHGNLLLVKYYLYFPGENYADGGNSVEVYYDRRMTELDPLSPETKLAPGQNFLFPEKWTLVPLEKEVTTLEDARKLVALIPPSPFAP